MSPKTKVSNEMRVIGWVMFICGIISYIYDFLMYEKLLILAETSPGSLGVLIGAPLVLIFWGGEIITNKKLQMPNWFKV